MLTAGCCIFLQAAARQASPLPELHFPPLEVGDVILRQGIGLDSMVIAKVSDSVYSHVGMVAAVNPEITIIHAAVDDLPDKANQVIASSLPFFVSKARRIAVKRYPMSAEERARAAWYLRSQLGQPFVLDGKRESLYCATLILHALSPQMSSGLNFHYLHLPGFEGWFLFPEDFWADERSRLIFKEQW